MFWSRGVTSVWMDSSPLDRLPSGSLRAGPNLFPFPLSSFGRTSPSAPLQKWKLLTRQHAKRNSKQEAVMTNISSVESKERTRVSTTLPRKWKKLRTSGASQGFLPSRIGQAAAWSLAGPACLRLQRQKPVILEDIGFLENTELYLWRSREGFPTQSEALG